MREYSRCPNVFRKIFRHSLLIALCAISANAQFLATPSAYAQGGYDVSDVYNPDDNGKEEATQDGGRNGSGRAQIAKPIAVNDIGGWFNQYDKIRRHYEMTAEERQYFDQLIARGPNANLGEDDAKFLQGLAQRYADAFNEMKDVDAISETSSLHTAYGIYLIEEANLCGDYMRVFTERNPVDKNGRPLIPGMADRRKALLSSEKALKNMEYHIKQSFNMR